MTHAVIVYTANHCPYCVFAKQLLEKKGIPYDEIAIDKDDALREIMVEKSGRQTVPQIFINGQSIGGYDDLYALDRKGELDTLTTRKEHE